MRFHPGLFPAKSLLTALLLASVFASSHVLADTADKLSAENAADNAVQQIKESATDSPSEPSNTESANTEPSETESSLEANKAKRTNSLKSKPDKTAAEKTSSGAYIMQLVMSLVVVLLAVAGVYAQSNPRKRPFHVR